MPQIWVQFYQEFVLNIWTWCCSTHIWWIMLHQWYLCMYVAFVTQGAAVLFDSTSMTASGQVLQNWKSSTQPRYIFNKGYHSLSNTHAERLSLFGKWMAGTKRNIWYYEPAPDGGRICLPRFSKITSKPVKPATSNLQYLILHHFDMFRENLSETSGGKYEKMMF